MARCDACKGTGRILASAPAKDNSPYVTTVEVICGVCNGTKVMPEEEPLQKPTKATTLKKVAHEKTEPESAEAPTKKSA
jgi:hypothetical protein